MALNDPRIYESTNIDGDIALGLCVISLLIGIGYWIFMRFCALPPYDTLIPENISGGEDSFVDAAMYLDMNGD